MKIKNKIKVLLSVILSLFCLSSCGVRNDETITTTDNTAESVTEENVYSTIKNYFYPDIDEGYDDETGTYTMYVKTDNMYPTIKSGDVIKIDTKDTKIEINGIYAIKTSDYIYATRVIAQNDDGTFQHKGDGNDEPNFESITEDDIYGKVIDITSTSF